MQALSLSVLRACIEEVLAMTSRPAGNAFAVNSRAWGRRARKSTFAQRPNCPSCGRLVLFAEHSRFDPDFGPALAPDAAPGGRIENAWRCDGCGTEFVTAMSVASGTRTMF
jgi:hypothetical protein